jgi:hypothetical protein
MNPFFAPPVNVSASLTGKTATPPETGALAELASLSSDSRLLKALTETDDPTIRDGLNLAIGRLTDPATPADSAGRRSCLIADGTGTGKSYQALLAAKTFARRAHKPACVITRRALIDGLKSDLVKLGLDSQELELVATEDLKMFSARAARQGRNFAIGVFDEAQDCSHATVRQGLDRLPTDKLLFLTATPFRDLASTSYLIAKLSGETPAAVRAKLLAADSPDAALRGLCCALTEQSAISHREFPFFGELGDPQIFCATRFVKAREQELLAKYEATRVAARGLNHSEANLDAELWALADHYRVGSIVPLIREQLEAGHKVVLFSDDQQVVSRVLKDHDGLPVRYGSPLEQIQQRLESEGIPVARLTSAVSPLTGTAGDVERNATQMELFTDGVYTRNSAGIRTTIRDADGNPVYAPGRVDVILMPYDQSAGWSDLNQRFAEAKPVTLVLAPTADADAFLQAAGRVSRRNSVGPAEIQITAQDLCGDRRRLEKLEKGLRWLGASGGLAPDFLRQAINTCLGRLADRAEKVALPPEKQAMSYQQRVTRGVAAAQNVVQPA